MCKQVYPEYNLECDHIIPLGQGGEDVAANTQILCISCHVEKSTNERNEDNKR